MNTYDATTDYTRAAYERWTITEGELSESLGNLQVVASGINLIAAILAKMSRDEGINMPADKLREMFCDIAMDALGAEAGNVVVAHAREGGK